MPDSEHHSQRHPIVIDRHQACEYGLEAATMIAVLNEFCVYQPSQIRNQFRWFRLDNTQAQILFPFWSAFDLDRVVQQLRGQGVLLIASAPFSSSGELRFAFNRRIEQEANQSGETSARGQYSEGRNTNFSSPIAPNWQPNADTLARIREHGIPEQFVRALVPEFVTYWRERGDTSRAWGAKFQSHALRQYRQFQTDQARQQRQQSQQTTLPPNWQPDHQVVAQLRAEDIPLNYIDECATRFRLYYHETGTTSASWGMVFYSWVKKDWQEKETPFLPNKKPVSMTNQWQPAAHTVEYLEKLDIDPQFIDDCVAEFVHKWIENGSFRNNWGDLFCQHVSKQWTYFREGVTVNPTATIINNDWAPTPECVELLKTQCEMDETFIASQIPEFILYWRNRGEPKHSWDSIFIRHLKYVWAKQHQLINHSTGNELANQSHERQQSGDPKRSTRDISLEESLTDRSWAY